MHTYIHNDVHNIHTYIHTYILDIMFIIIIELLSDILGEMEIMLASAPDPYENSTTFFPTRSDPHEETRCARFIYTDAVYVFPIWREISHPVDTFST